MFGREKRPQFIFDISGDFHLGHPNPPQRNPTEEEVRESLQRAVDRRVDGYIMVGDGVHDNNIEEAHRLAHIYKEYTDQGLRIFVMKGNHDEDPEIGTILAQEGGVNLLDGKIVTLRKGRRRVALIGATSEFGKEHTEWWKADNVEEARKRVRDEAPKYEQFLQNAIRKTKARDLVVATHRGIISETVGTAPSQHGEKLSPQIERYAEIIRQESRTRFLRTKRRISVVHGHDHGDYPWEGGLEGKIGHVPVYNVAAPLRRRINSQASLAMSMQI